MELQSAVMMGQLRHQRVNIYMEKERVADFYAALAQGSLRVVKAEDTDSQEE